MINLSFLRRLFQKLILRYIYLFVAGRFVWKIFFLLASIFDEKIRQKSAQTVPALGRPQNYPLNTKCMVCTLFGDRFVKQSSLEFEILEAFLYYVA
jgi:hypothetical protein